MDGERYVMLTLIKRKQIKAILILGRATSKTRKLPRIKKGIT